MCNAFYVQIIEFEDLVQAADDSKLRAEVKLTSVQQELERAMAAKDSELEDKRRSLVKQLRDVGEELDEERKMRTTTLKNLKLAEHRVRELESEVETANRVRDEFARVNKKTNVSMGYCTIV